MCGRFSLSTPACVIARFFGAAGPVPDLDPRYNIAPSQGVLIVRAGSTRAASSVGGTDAGRGEGTRELAVLRWGLIPHWAREPDVGVAPINARSETADAKPAFHNAFRKRRCVIPADAFYEWKVTESGKRPMCIQPRGGGFFSLAGLWERWEPEDQPTGAVESCTILTTAANSLVGPIHDRMPVILDRAGIEAWLDASIEETPRLKALCRPCPPEALKAHEVGRRVNSPRNDGPELVTPVGPEEEQGGLFSTSE